MLTCAAIGSYGTYESQIRVAIEPLKQQHLDLIARKGYEAVEVCHTGHIFARPFLQLACHGDMCTYSSARATLTASR